jgi:hypothetical protein
VSADGVVLDVLPPMAAWRHIGERDGVEVTRFTPYDDGVRIEGATSAAEGVTAWWVHYVIEVDASWSTSSAIIEGGSDAGVHRRRLATAGSGRWMVDGEHDPRLDGCMDVDLESSACTNTVPVHRLARALRGGTAAPAVYVRAEGLAIERLEQSYEGATVDRTDDAGHILVGYAAPRFGYVETLRLDHSGLVVDYPGLARRIR